MKVFFWLIISLLFSFSEVHAHLRIQEITSAKGIKAWLVEDHTTPVIALNFSFEAGASQDPEDKLGLAELVSQMLTQGAGKYNSHDFAKKLQEIASFISFNVTISHFQGSLKTTQTNAKEAFQLLKTTLAAPLFSADEFKKVANAHITTLSNLEKQPSTIALYHLRKQIFGPSHPYARLVEGSLKTVPKIHANDLKNYLKNLGRDTLKIGVCGNISAQELAKVLDEIFSSLPQKSTLTPISSIQFPQKEKFTTIKLSQPQSIGLFAQQAIPFKNPDFLKASIANEALGHGSVSRLMSEVREKRGYAYHVGTNIDQEPLMSLLIGSVGSQNSRIMKSLALIKEEWKRIRDHGLNEKEFADAKSHILGAYTLNFMSSPQIAELLLLYQEIDAPITYIQKREQLINAITLEQVNNFTKTFFTPERLQIVVVGNPETGEHDAQ
ncbi:MAG: hypothetical protein BGO77_00145 [Caedibacter sp. 37-49]|nr:MAG: hypothetical protein BGO77_00145 [Caedibacter sp. 37-49]